MSVIEHLMADGPCIYALLDHDGRCRYIGKANDPQARLRSHMRDARRRDTPLYRWIRKNGEPQMVVVVENSEDWRRDERLVIAGLREQGERLLNVADGGDEPYCPASTRSANGIALNVRLKAEPRLARLRALKAELGRALKRGWVGEASREKMRSLAISHPHLFADWNNV